MINPDFEKLLKDSFINGFDMSLKDCLPNEQWEIKELRENKGVERNEAVVLTISSHLFRIIYFFYFTNDEKCQSFITNGLNIKNENLPESRVYDYLCEVGNSFFGSVKRTLGNTVTSLGMSTPNILDSSSFKYVDELKIDSSGCAVAELNGEPLFYASYHISASGELNFAVAQNQKAEEDVDSGELEFF
ncbi:MAG: hypothetical protein HRT35_07145 [Algicola sp.]|nr:hypothetical protein [Algicola sp.]